MEFGSAELWGDHEPDFSMLQSAILQHGTLEDFREFIWCGYGEPTFRMDLILEAAAWLGSRGAVIRLNTNGQACLIHDRDILHELGGAVDVVSVSLNAPNATRYLELCRPDPEAFPDPGKIMANPEITWETMLDFLYRAPDYFSLVQASVVGFSLLSTEIEQCRELALSMGIKKFRVR
jgi:TatD DNase family protein